MVSDKGYLKLLERIIGALYAIGGIGHILMILIVQRQTTFWVMAGAGILYTTMSIMVFFGKKLVIYINTVIMFVVAIGASIIIHNLGYPIEVLRILIGIDFLSVALAVVWMLRSWV